MALKKAVAVATIQPSILADMQIPAVRDDYCVEQPQRVRLMIEGTPIFSPELRPE